MVRIENDGRVLGTIKAGACAGEENVTTENLKNKPSNVSAFSCYAERALTCYLLVLGRKGLKSFREKAFLMGMKKDVRLLEGMLMRNLRQKKNWRSASKSRDAHD